MESTILLMQTRNKQKRDIGLVLCGGGAKGAYQIGVWKYLKEVGVDQRIAAIIGASIGALNSLLIAQDEYDKAVLLWKSLRQGDLFASASDWKEIRQLLLQRNFSFFTQDRISYFIDSGLACWRPNALPMDLYVGLSIEKDLSLDPLSSDTKFRARELLFESEFYKINSLDKEDITNLLLASSAIPGIYPSHTIEGKKTVDGGVIDNSPVRPLIEQGLKKILVVHLNEDGPDEKMKWEKSIAGLDVEDVIFYPVYPSEPISFFDTFVVNKVLTMGRMDLGYEDAKNQLSKLGE